MVIGNSIFRNKIHRRLYFIVIQTNRHSLRCFSSRPGHTRQDLEAPNEKVAMELAIHRADDFNMKTLVAVPAEEARKLVD